MSLLLRVPNLRSGYLDIRDAILAEGHRKSPRGQDTIEVRDLTFVLEDPTDALPVGVGRQLNLKIGMLEAAQLIGGVAADPLLIARLAPHMAAFAAEPDGTYWGSYGRRIGTQMLEVEAKLLDDPDTRRAVVTLWDPQLDNEPDHRDHPCTVALMFAIDNDKLVMKTTMRSNDFWLGLAYDAFQFTQLQLTLATALGIEAGEYTHTAWSMHLYDRDRDVAKSLTFVDDGTRGFRFEGLGRALDDMGLRMSRAICLIDNIPLADPTPTEKAYASAFA